MSNHDKLLHQLAIKGFGKTEALVESMALPEAEVVETLAALESEGLTLATRVGVRLSPEGKLAAAKIIAGQKDAADAARLDAEHDRFQPLNSTYKKLVTDWQMRDVNGGQIPNDHSDAEYDGKIMEGMADIHARITTLLNEMQDHVPHMADYVARFDAALKRIEAGEHKYMTAPIIDSYHTIWFELHQDLIGLLGRDRASEAAAGRAV